MRDDSKDIIDRLHAYQSNKSQLLQKLLLNETQLLFTIKAGNAEKAADLLDDAQAIIDEVDRIDASIAGEVDALSLQSGVEAGDCSSFPAIAGVAGLDDIKPLIAVNRELTGEIYRKREEVHALLSHEYKELEKNIEGLSRVRRIRFSKTE